MTAPNHAIFGRPMGAPAPHGFEEIVLGMGCYWGVERLFWQQDGVWLTEVGFAGGSVDDPSYKQVCGGRTGHAEVVRVVFDPSRISVEQILKIFWENHDPTQGNRQGNDVGDQYRSVIFTTNDSQLAAAEASRVDYDNRLAVAGFPAITTQIAPLTRFWRAREEDHQQYLHKVPHGYCGLRGTGVQASQAAALHEAAVGAGDGNPEPSPSSAGGGSTVVGGAA
ncbi:peptide-methionine (S)-S-oxide reductase MsrA [Paracoccus endophyticus]|uniref:peptide-methionine (S)-S-oxide reductase MsrA n=1 Tax=Paracoccus endophyticus TaxID=2233774 RepID=UPI000DD6C34A|nr:peptide-methionine (S)-S-oxide reductase MsrA [Paracoccus endophyticus]